MSTDTVESTGASSSLARPSAATALKTWGVIVTLGWLVSQGVALAGLPAAQAEIGLTAFWLVGSLVPLSVSAQWMRLHGTVPVYPLWGALGVTGLVVSAAVALGVVGVAPALVYGGLWFAGPAVGFAVTAALVDDGTGRLYAAAAVLNLVGAALVVSVPAFEAVYFLAAAVVQGVPMYYHGTLLAGDRR